MAGVCCNSAALSFTFDLKEANVDGSRVKCFKKTQRMVVCSSRRMRGRGAVNAVSGGDLAESQKGGSYLSMWKRAQERHESERLQQVENAEQEAEREKETRKRREEQFSRLLDVPEEDRDRIQRLQVVDRAAAALAAAEALLATQPTSSFSPNKPQKTSQKEPPLPGELKTTNNTGAFSASRDLPSTATSEHTPGPDFWTWSPPPVEYEDDDGISNIGLLPKHSSLPAANPVVSVLELDKAQGSLDIDFESKASEENPPKSLPLVFQSRIGPTLPPLQSLLEVEKGTTPKLETNTMREFSIAVPHLEKVVASSVDVKDQSKGETANGMNVDGSRWWRETGTDSRGNGITCNWTVTRGVSKDGAVEWEEKFWEASDSFDYKELGAEKSGRDARGNVWREFWQEAMWQDSKTGVLHMEKSADKWGKDGTGGKWHEKWWEHYDASGRAEKWADKWSQIDHNTPLEPGHAHVWHERWGEEFDGHGGCMKYTDKWAERSEFGGLWTKWGDKWDERFHPDSKGVKQGETWWEGVNGERWNRTWGEEHNTTGWVHKYGQSSSGEHWDCHEQQETWYERKPHYGFLECLDNSQELQRIGRRKKHGL